MSLFPLCLLKSYDENVLKESGRFSVTKDQQLDKIRELEDTKNVNPHQKWIHLAQAVDSWRIFPRIFITTYIFLLYKVVIWYMDLAAPTMEQSGLVSIVVGAGAAWFGLYTGSRAKSSK